MVHEVESHHEVQLVGTQSASVWLVQVVLKQQDLEIC